MHLTPMHNDTDGCDIAVQKNNNDDESDDSDDVLQKNSMQLRCMVLKITPTRSSM